MTTQRGVLSALCGAAMLLTGCGGGGSGSGGGLFGGPTNSNPAAINFSSSIIAVPNVPVPVAPAPPGPYWSFDIGLVDNATGIYYLADKTNCGVDVFDANANTYLTTIGPATSPPTFATVGASCASIGSPFKGNTGSSSKSGPNGLVQISATKMYAADGDGTIKVINLQTRKVTGTIVVPGGSNPAPTTRADEGSYDPDDGIVLIAHDAEPSPLLTYINAATDTVIGQTVRKDATGGMEDSKYIPQLHAFAQAVPKTTANKNGEIDIIDPVSRTIKAVYPMSGACGPTGISLGPNSRLLVACGDPGSTYIIDITNGSTLAQINQAGGGDETAYDATTNRFYVANSNNTSNGVKGGPAQPSVTVIDAGSMFFIQNLPSEAHAHSMATYKGKVFNPIPSSGVEVFR